MGQAVPNCAILAIRHMELAEGMRGLLETSFAAVYVVADLDSLREGVKQLAPDLVVLDIPIAEGGIKDLLENIRAASPHSKLVVVSVHDQGTIPRLALAAGANAVILKRTIGSDLLPAVSAVMKDKGFLSAAFGLGEFPGEAPDAGNGNIDRMRTH